MSLAAAHKTSHEFLTEKKQVQLPTISRVQAATTPVKRPRRPPHSDKRPTNSSLQAAELLGAQTEQKPQVPPAILKLERSEAFTAQGDGQFAQFGAHPRYQVNAADARANQLSPLLNRAPGYGARVQRLRHPTEGARQNMKLTTDASESATFADVPEETTPRMHTKT